MRFKPRTLLLILTALALVPGASQADPADALYQQKCGRCHPAYPPSDYAPDEWGGVVRSMKAQAALTGSDVEQLTQYLEEASRAAGGEEGSGAQGPTLGGYLYAEYFETPSRTKNYDIHYLALYVSGWASEKISYFGEFELEHGGKGDNTFVEQAFIDYWVHPQVAAKAGAMLTPFNRFDDFHEPIANYTITRPQLSREIGVSAWKEVGVDLHGYANLGEQLSALFDLYTVNGLGDGSNLRGSRQYRDNNEDKALGGRLVLLLNDALEVGGSAYRGAWDDAGELDVEIFGAHALVHTEHVDLYGEFASATSQNPDDTPDGEMDGFFVQASKLIEGKYRPTVRFGKLDYLDEGTLLGRDPGKGNADVTETVLAFAFYPTNRVVYKIEYTLFSEGDRLDEKDNDQLGIQAAVRF